MPGEPLVVAGIEAAATAGSVTKLGASLEGVTSAAGKATPAVRGFSSAVVAQNGIIASAISTFDKLIGRYVTLYTNIEKNIDSSNRYRTSLYDIGLVTDKTEGGIRRLGDQFTALSAKTYLSIQSIAELYKQFQYSAAALPFDQFERFTTLVSRVFPGREKEILGEYQGIFARSPVIANMMLQGGPRTREQAQYIQATQGLVPALTALQLAEGGGAGGGRIQGLQDLMPGAIKQADLNKYFANKSTGMGSLLNDTLVDKNTTTAYYTASISLLSVIAAVAGGYGLMRMFRGAQGALGRSRAMAAAGGGTTGGTTGTLLDRFGKPIAPTTAIATTAGGAMKVSVVQMLGYAAAISWATVLGQYAADAIDKRTRIAEERAEEFGGDITQQVTPESQKKTTSFLGRMFSYRTREALKVQLEQQQHLEKLAKARGTTIADITKEWQKQNELGKTRLNKLQEEAIVLEKFLSFIREVQEASNTVTGQYQAQMQLITTIGGFEADHLDIIQKQIDVREAESAILDKVLKGKALNFEDTKKIAEMGFGEVATGIKIDGLERARLETAKTRADIEIFNLKLQKDGLALRDREVYLASQHQQQIQAVLSASQLMQVPFTLTLGLQKQISDETLKKLEAEKAYLQVLEKSVQVQIDKGIPVSKEQNALLEVQKTKVAEAGAAYISSIAYVRRGWLEGFTSAILGGGAPGKLPSGIPILPAEGQIKGAGWMEGMPLTKGAIEKVGGGMYTPERATKSWEETVYPGFGGGPADQTALLMRTFKDYFTNNILNVREVDKNTVSLESS